MALKPNKLRPKSRGRLTHTQEQIKADRKPEGPSRDHLYNNVGGTKTHIREEKDVYFINKNLSLYNWFSLLDGLEEDPFYFPNQFYVRQNTVNFEYYNYVDDHINNKNKNDFNDYNMYNKGKYDDIKNNSDYKNIKCIPNAYFTEGPKERTDDYVCKIDLCYTHDENNNLYENYSNSFISPINNSNFRYKKPSNNKNLAIINKSGQKTTTNLPQSNPLHSNQQKNPKTNPPQSGAPQSAQQAN